MQGRNVFSRNDEVIKLVSANHYQPLRAPKFNIRVLVAPLDWGLGHATRCIPIIQQLLAKGCTVIIATDGSQQLLLEQEFTPGSSGIEYVKLGGYGVRYAKKFLLLRLMLQLPSIKRAIARENNWIREIIKSKRIDGVISDNRYGLYCPGIPSVFMTHQLRVKGPNGWKAGEKWVQKKLYQYINRFSVCWVPDLADEQRGLSGELGHPGLKPSTPVWYTGWLSRFKPIEEKQDFQYKCLVTLSGPEPQRTLLEQKLVAQLQQITSPVLFVRGLPGSTSELSLPSHIKVFPHLDAAALQHAVVSSEFIISRCGYSTLMDAFTMQKKCIFIPTPGQTEQEYLGKRLAAQQMAVVLEQDNFELKNAFEIATNFTFHFPLNSMNNLLEMAIDHFLQLHFPEKTNPES